MTTASTSAGSRSRLSAIPAKKRGTGWNSKDARFLAWASRTCPNRFPSGAWTFRIPQAPKVISRLKTGLLVGAPSDNGKTVGGSAPNFLATHGDALFVSNGNNDMIERIDLAKNRIVAKERIVPVAVGGPSARRRSRRAWRCRRTASDFTSPNWASTPSPCWTPGRWRCSATSRPRGTPTASRSRRTGGNSSAFASAASAMGRTRARKSRRAISSACAAWSAFSMCHPTANSRR